MRDMISFTLAALAAVLVLPVESHAQEGERAEGQTPEQEAIRQLEFLTGSWAGEGRIFAADGTYSTYHDTEKVWFDANDNLLIIQANGFRDGERTYSLHTVIYYDAVAGNYKYKPFTGGSDPVPLVCALEQGEFRCLNAEGTYRLTFRRLDNGDWNEFGEAYREGAWTKNFETILQAAG